MTARIVIIGAGLGGLTAGIALCRAGFSVAIYEQAAQLAEAGAGISLSQAVMRVFRHLDLAAAVEDQATITTGIAFLHYRSAALLAGMLDLGQTPPDATAPLAAWQLHRADLQQLLLKAFAAAGGQLYLGRRLLDLAPRGNLPRLRFSEGNSIEADLVIGADGLKSVVRAALWGAQPARFTGQVAYRFLVPTAVGQPYLQFGRAAVFQGPGRVFNRYTIRAGRLINCVGIVQSDDWQEEGWSTPATAAEVLAQYRGWHDDVTGLVAKGDHMIKWGLFDRPPLPRWSQDGVTLLGDAAHPMLPFLGLGAAMAIEDAAILARALAAEPDCTAALGRYEAARRPRTELVQEQSRRQGALVQDSDPDRFAPGSAPSHDPAYYAYDPVAAPV